MNSPASFVFPSDPNAMVPHGDASPTPRMDPSLSDPFHQAAEPIIGALFIDNLAKDMELDVVQRNHLQILNQLGSVDGGLTKADLATRLYQLAIAFAHANEKKKANKDGSMADFTQLLEDLRTRLDDGYLFTKEQLRNIRTQAQDTIYEAARTSFMGMHTDVMQKLRDNKAALKLNGVFGNPSREKSLVSIVKRTCSSVRNSLRQDVRNSICGDNTATLAAFTYSSATKFKRGGPGLSLDVGYSIHMALLRRFAMENPSAIGVEEIEDDESNEDPGSSPAPPSKKRKITATGHAGGRVPKGKDFWSQADAFFARKIAEFGSKSLQGSGWKEYASETLQLDEFRFPSATDEELATSNPSSSSSTPSSAAQTNETKGSIVALSCVVTAPPLSTAVKHVHGIKNYMAYTTYTLSLLASPFRLIHPRITHPSLHPHPHPMRPSSRFALPSRPCPCVGILRPPRTSLSLVSHLARRAPPPHISVV
ncbi:hypothetical protein B0H14DRAFT_3431624 [Mycena olivaceomarginata]|nr:hypothetical protein B0H14DRAFT_3431624 [Mycena olivaceomarginata]